MATEITNHIDLDNAVAEMHDEMYRMVDADEAGDIPAAVQSYNKVSEQMEAVRIYLTTKEKGSD